MKTEYVLGFALSSLRQRVVLIRKTKPEWQVGKLNGVGGKIENESKYTAMHREFREETGYATKGELWSYFCRLEGDDFEVHCFATIIDVGECRTVEAEEVEIIQVKDLENYRQSMVENLPWLINLAIDHLDDKRPSFVVAKYPEVRP